MTLGISAGQAITGVVRKRQGRVVGLSAMSGFQIAGRAAPQFGVVYTIPGTLALSIGTDQWVPRSDGQINSIALRFGEAPRKSSPPSPADNFGTLLQLVRNGIGVRLLGMPYDRTGNFDPGVTTFQAGDVFTVDIIALGTAFPGADATLTFDVT